MKKMAIVILAASCLTLAGCGDPAYQQAPPDKNLIFPVVSSARIGG